MTVDIHAKPTIRNRTRMISYDWELQRISDTVHEDAVLTVMHDGDRKCFTNILREPVARFSQKRLEEFGGRALAELRERDRAEDEKILKQLTPSDRSCGCTNTHHDAGCEVYAASVRS